ncbi:MAG: aldo/keto reductase [Spirochaetaceae bacterium]|nr:MAG: aldo/keto reductase [Spirochaetaceae bacterium]
METRRLGSSDLRVSVVGFGCWGIAGGAMWGDQDEQQSIDSLLAAVDNGITFFDTAEGYGDGYSEEVVGKALAGRRADVVIATKVSPSNLAPASLRHSCEQSLRRLRTDVIDLYQIHWPSFPGDPDDVVETMAALRSEGKIRHLGVSNFGSTDLSRYPDGLFVSNQIAYSLAFRATEYSIVPESLRRGMGLITYSSLLHGVLTGRFRNADEVPAGRARTRHFSGAREQVRHDESGHEDELFALVDRLRVIAAEHGVEPRVAALLWVVAQPGVATVLAGSRTVEQAIDNASILTQTLPESAINALTAASETLKRDMGPNPDMWQTDSRVERGSTSSA